MWSLKPGHSFETASIAPPPSVSGTEYGGAAVVIESVSMADMEFAWNLGLTYPDQDFSLVDRTSFAVMGRLGLDRAASLDDHFAVFRLGPGRKSAFTLLR
jgi:uncharacterized protein